MSELKSTLEKLEPRRRKQSHLLLDLILIVGVLSFVFWLVQKIFELTK